MDNQRTRAEERADVLRQLRERRMKLIGELAEVDRLIKELEKPPKIKRVP